MFQAILCTIAARGSGNYHRQALGLADDIIPEGNLSFDQATRKARELVASVRASRERERRPARHTVRSAIGVYIQVRDNRVRTQSFGSRGRVFVRLAA